MSVRHSIKHALLFFFSLLMPFRQLTFAVLGMDTIPPRKMAIFFLLIISKRKNSIESGPAFWYTPSPTRGFFLGMGSGRKFPACGPRALMRAGKKRPAGSRARAQPEPIPSFFVLLLPPPPRHPPLHPPLLLLRRRRHEGPPPPPHRLLEPRPPWRGLRVRGLPVHLLASHPAALRRGRGHRQRLKNIVKWAVFLLTNRHPLAGVYTKSRFLQ